MEVAKKNTRLEWIDISKGIGIFLVVLGHAILGNLLLKTQNKSLYDFGVNFLWSFHMPLFFFLSGLFLPKLIDKQIKQTFYLKLQTILYPYIVWSVILGLTYIIISHLPSIQHGANNTITFKQFIMFPINPILNLWFLYALFWGQLLYVFLIKILKSKYLFIFLLSLMLYYLNPFKFIWIFSHLFSRNFIFLVFGAFLAQKHNKILTFALKKDNISYIVLFIIIFILLNISIATIPELYNFFQNTGLIIIPAIMGTFSIVYFSQLIQSYKLSKILSYLGKMSLYIYLIHVFITPATRIILEKIFHIDNYSLTIILSTLSGLIFPIFFIKISTKFNFNKFLFGKI